MKTILLYGETFEVVYPRSGVTEFVPDFRYHTTDIYRAYQKPSIYKVQIWDYWKNFGLPEDETEKYHIGVPVITSHNCFKFTVRFNVYDMETREFAGVAVVTADHNRLYLKEVD